MEDNILTEVDIARIEAFAGCTIFGAKEVKEWLQCYISGWRCRHNDELVGMMQAIQAKGYNDLISGYIKMKPEFDKPTYNKLETELVRFRTAIESIRFYLGGIHNTIDDVEDEVALRHNAQKALEVAIQALEAKQ